MMSFSDEKLILFTKVGEEEGRIAPPLQRLCKLVLVREFCFQRLRITNVEPAAHLLEGFFGGNRAGGDRVQDREQNLLAGRQVQPPVHGSQFVPRLLDLIHPLAQRNEVSLDFGEVNRLTKRHNGIIEIVAGAIMHLA